MATKSELFLFEVVIEKLNCFVENRLIVIKCDFANIFSLELKDPKTMHIKIPDPPPLPPEPPGKKKKKKPKPKKKGKKGKEPPPPPEPEILTGQSILITSSAEVLLQNMRSNPMGISLWSKEDTLVFIGSSYITWDEAFPKYLEKIYSCANATPAFVKDEYNVFEENTAKLIAKMTMQVKLSYLTDRIVSSFRTLTEDDAIKKVLYTGMNSKTTSVMCTLKTTEEEYQANLAKIPNNYIKDKELAPVLEPKPIVYADFKNAPGAVMPFSSSKEYCCAGNVDKPPDDKYDSPEAFAGIDYICDYVRKIISSCNDNMRMLRPRPAIKPRVRATDLDKLCYCKETAWPKGDLAERFRRETQGGPCPVCIRQIDGKLRTAGAEGASRRVLDIANIRGPCGRPDCRIARDIRAYLEKLVEEDNKEIRLDDIVGPCGSKECTLVDKIKDFLTHRGKFSHERTKPGLSTQCDCLDQMQNALIRKGSCTSICSHDCENEDDNCEGKACPYRSTHKGPSAKDKSKQTPPDLPKILHDKKPDNEPESKPPPPQPESKSPPSQPESKPTTPQPESKPPSPPPESKPPPPKPESKPPSPPKPNTDKNVYYVYYFTVEYDNKDSLPTSPASTKSPTTTTTAGQSTAGQSTAGQSAATTPSAQSGATSPSATATPSSVIGKKTNKFKHCAPLCPTAFRNRQVCSKSVCQIPEKPKQKLSLSCTNVKCPTREADKQPPRTPSPADSNVELKFSDIRNPCCVKSCDITERVKDIIVEGLAKKSKQTSKYEDKNDPCFCDCVCEFPMAGQTTYCSICGGYENLGEAVREQPAYLQPHPCPVYHKLQEIKKPEVPPPEDDDTRSGKGKSGYGKQLRLMHSVTGTKTGTETPDQTIKESHKRKKDKKKKGKHHGNEPIGAPASCGQYHKYCHTFIEAVPKHMGWLWTAEDIPGMKFRPKWRPGAANKILVRRYRTVREGVDIILKKKRALMNRKKKIEMKPTLIVTKKEGEYTVQMEVFKKYSKERLRYQYPYDEKPPLIYTIGKTEAVKAKEQRQRERKERRENRRKCRMLQSTFRDKCQEICVKAYNQSIGLLPMPNANSPDCPCDIQQVKVPTPVIDSCSCSDAGTISSSDTDGDDWIIEFTPPMARWDGKAKHAPNTTCTESQYNYLDYKVKILDKQGNQVPRFFKGPDGKEECSDLGGFYGMDHTWLEINKDGFIGPDNRWVPLNFTGPDGGYYLSEEGHFTDSTGATWKIGIDGYVDKDNKWQWYGGRRRAAEKPSTVHATPAALPHEPGKISKDASQQKKVVHTIGQGKGRSHTRLTHHEKEKKPASSHASTSKVNEKEKHSNKGKKVTTTTHQGRTPLMVHHTAMNYNNKRQQQDRMEAKRMREMEIEKLARYQEIMEGLEMYEDLSRLRTPMKTNRAVETRTKQISSKYSVYDSNGQLVSSSRKRSF